ncbi:hypothetical protein B4U79_17646 [Dinothrombium tinctorium]|uniref:Uncharacterized protein n=1 Tax=Dinothrombium tinctorium TaxID=1965070 RepID=A0A443R484_9ACAR|nr:hypothetical protein B4U79_17646 [Dinothrombium tinctorium]
MFPTYLFISVILLKLNAIECKGNPCKTPKIDGMIWSSKFRTNTTVLLFNEEYIYEFDFNTQKLKEVARINRIWPEVKVPIDGATAIQRLIDKKAMKFYEEEILFFKDPNYWVYKSKAEYKKRENLNRSGTFEFYGDTKKVIHKSISFSLNRKHVQSPYRIILTTKDYIIHVCGSLEKRVNNSNEYKLIIGDPKLDKEKLNNGITECQSYGKKYGEIVVSHERRYHGKRMYLIFANRRFFNVWYSDDGGLIFEKV